MNLVQLTKTQRDEYTRTLRTGYLMRIVVDFLDTDGATTATFATQGGATTPLDVPQEQAIVITAGDVQMDLDADISRTCRLEIEDDAGMLRYGPRDAHDWVVYVGRMVKVTYGVWLPVAGEWADVPVFTGPVTQFERVGASVTLDCAGKEWFLLEPFVKWRSMSWKAHTTVVHIMRAILLDQGEKPGNLRGFPANPQHRFTKPYSIARWDEPWPILRRLAQLAGDKLIYYAGDGACVLRNKQTVSAWDFAEGMDILDQPTFSWDLEALRNAAAVEWTKGDKRQAPEVAILGKNDSLSPQNLSRNQKPLVMANRVDSTVTTPAAAKSRAAQELNRTSETPVTVAFDALPVPHLEEYMRCTATWEGLKTAFTLRSFTLGLQPGASMSVNINTDQVRKMSKVVT